MADNAKAYYLPQSYPLWAVIACTEDEHPEIGLVVGWEGHHEGGSRQPIVVAEGGNYAWTATHVASVSNTAHGPSGWVEQVWVFPTREQAVAFIGTAWQSVLDEWDAAAARATAA